METELKITISQFRNSTDTRNGRLLADVSKREMRSGSMDVVKSSHRAWIDARSCRFIYIKVDLEKSVSIVETSSRHLVEQYSLLTSNLR